MKNFFQILLKLFGLQKYIVILICSFYSYFSFAIDYKEYLLLHNSNQCNNYFNYFELKHQIPQHLLRSISIVETGRWHTQTQMYLPWPWSINHAGKSYYLSGKKEAVLKVKELLDAGYTNIDIGCMQINLHHHPEAFLDLNHAFEPKDNIEYAAGFLIRNYQQSQNWQQAIAFYHSQSAAGELYAKKVLKIWSAYKDNKPYSTYCANGNGSIIPCNNATAANIYSTSKKEKLPLSQANDTNYREASTKRSPMDLKKIKSSMILYSIHNEQ